MTLILLLISQEQNSSAVHLVRPPSTAALRVSIFHEVARLSQARPGSDRACWARSALQRSYDRRSVPSALWLD